MKRPLISIIIPTRNRQFYAEKTVLQILKIKGDIEIVVQDNSDKDSLFTVLNDLIREGKVKYNYDGEPLSFSENYDRAAQMAGGQYLCAIGDDDGVLPSIIDCAIWMNDNGVDAVSPAKDQVFFYPGNDNKRKNACVGFGQYTGTYYYSNSEAAVISLLNDGGCNYLDKKTAGSYHGLVSMRSMKIVNSLTGHYYSGLTPDMYSAICLSLVPELRFAVVDYPITLPGVCPLSGSAASDTGKHVGSIETAPHLKLLPNYEWSNLIPKYYSVETIWAETMVYSINKMGRGELIDRYFNRNKLASNLYCNNERHREEILSVIGGELAEYVQKSCRDYNLTFKGQIASKIKNATTKFSGERTVIRHVVDINEAVEMLSDKIKRIEKPWR